MKQRFIPLLLLTLAIPAEALPGYGVQLVAPTSGFGTSIAIDSHGTIYYTTKNGDIDRIDSSGQSSLVAHLVVNDVSDSGLLGMALLNDNTAAVHYVNASETADVISTVDLTTGQETVLQSLTCNIDSPSRPVPAEHHGGNPTAGADGSIFVGIGDYGGGLIASLPEWNAGKIFRILPDGALVQFASGLRNPFGMVWDAAHQRLIASDNGAVGNDTIRIIQQGDGEGWPFTEGTEPPIPGAVPPLYTWPFTGAPTGVIALSGRNPTLNRGYLICGFVTKAIYWVPDIDARPLPDPIPLVSGQTDGIIDVAEGPNGEIDFVTGSGVYRLDVPVRVRAVRH